MTWLAKRAFALLLLGCASGPDGSPEDEGPCPVPDRWRCSPDDPRVFERCSVDGPWVQVGACAGECDDGECVDTECADGATRCAGAAATQRCVGDVGGWTFAQPCGDAEICVEGECAEIVCEPGALLCAGAEVRVCDLLGTGSSKVMDCGKGNICNGGTCVDACGMAEAQDSFIGCRYYAVDTDNAGVTSVGGYSYDDDAGQFDLIVSNADPSSPAIVTVERRGEDGAWTAVVDREVEPEALAVIPLACTDRGCDSDPCSPTNAAPDAHVEDTAIGRGAAFRVTSDRPIVAYQLNADDRNGCASSSGSATLLPAHVLGMDHYALTLPGNPEEQRGWVAVVAAGDGTDVTVLAAAPTVAGEDVPALAAGETYAVTLDEGDVLQLSSLADGDDLSGTHVVSSAPVAVFAGHECAAPAGGTCNPSSGNGDHVEEQMMPVQAWGTVFVAARLTHPQLSPTEPAIVKVVAAEGGTEVEFASGSGVDLPPRWTLDAGEVRAIEVPGTPGTPPHFVLESSSPVMVEQFTTGEPVAIVVVPTEQYRTGYLFIAPPFFDDRLVVARPESAGVLLDGDEPPDLWREAGGGYLVEGLDLGDGAHVVESDDGVARIGAQVIGMDGNCSYGYLAGLDVEPINVR